MSTAAEHHGLPDEGYDLVQAQYEASGTIYGSNDPAEILDAFLSFAGSRFSAGHLALVEPSQTTVTIIAQADADGVRAAQEQRNLEQYPAFDTLSAVEVLNIEDVATDSFLTDAERARLTKDQIRSLVIVPMVVGQRLIGLVEFTHPEIIRLSSAHLRALRSLADQAAVVYENQSLLRNTEATLEEVRALYDINRALLGAQDIATVLRLLRDHLTPTAATLLYMGFERTPDQREFWSLRHRIDGATETTPYTNVDLPPTLTSARDGDPNESVTFREPLDPGSTDPLDQLMREQGVASYAAFLLGEDGSVEEIIALGFSEPVTFDSRSRRLYLAVADQTAIVLQNQKLLRSTEANTAQLTRQVRVLQAVNRLATGLGTFKDETSLLEFTIHQMTTSLDADHGGLMLFDPEINFGTVVAEFPDHGTSGLRLDMRGNRLLEPLKADPTKPFIVYDVEYDERVTPETLEVFRSIGIKSLMMVPITLDGRLVGSIGLDLYTRERQFTPEMIEMGQTMAAQLAAGLLNLRLLSDAQRRAEQLQRIATFSQSLQAALDPAAILESMLTVSAQMLPVERMQIALYDETARVLHVAAHSEGGKVEVNLASGTEIPLADTLEGDVWDSGQMLYINDMENSPHRARTSETSAASLLIAPFRLRGRVAGLIRITGSEQQAFSETDVALFQQMLTQFAVTMQNSEAYAQSQRAAQNQALVNDITAQLQRNSDIQQMLEISLQELGKALGARRARVRLSPSTDGSMNGAG